MFDGGKISFGVVFKVTPEGSETVLHTFLGGSDGAHPKGSLIADSDGNLYGTTFSGGTSNDGVVFEITPEGDETVLHDFSGSDGSTPYSGLIISQDGILYGTTGFGGTLNQGTVFQSTP